MILTSSTQVLPASQQVNRIGKYLFKHIDGAFKYSKSSNQYDIYFTLLYQIPYWERIPGKGSEYNDVHEMTIDINLTTYQNKLRVNVIETSPEERTIGYDLYRPEVLTDLPEAMKLIWFGVIKRVSKAYKDYDFIF